MALIIKNPGDYSRGDINLGSVVAGAAGVTSKFVAFANVLLFGLTTYMTTIGTTGTGGAGTYTGPNGTATTAAQQLYVIVVTNTSTTSTVGLATTSIGPFLAGGQGTVAQVGGGNQWAINTTTGTQGQGGVLVPEGALVYVLSGTDATAVTAVTLDYQIAPFAPVVA